jgi:glycosyltransferase involved in cell wall biosynthesis
LASFTASLASALGDGTGSTEVGVVRVVERADRKSSSEVVHHLVTEVGGGEAAAAAALDQFGVAIIQHEYGIYGGHDGETVIGVLRRLRVPAIVVLHTVLVEPTVHQRQVLEEVARAASVVVVMTETARRRLLQGYAVDPGKIALIAHGAPTDWAVTEPSTGGGSSLVLTWGLIGPGKGIEWAVEALAALQDLDPAPRYVVAGETHPQVLERDGESYRTMLVARASELGISHKVSFDNRYLDRPALRALVRDADVVVLPYDSPDQVTSGVLIEAVTAGRPVVATAFPHAVELLSSGAGTIVPHRDPDGIAAAVRRILAEPGVAAAMGDAAGRLVPDLTWAAVAERYRQLGQRLRREATSVVA